MSLYVDELIKLQESDLNVIKIAWSCQGSYLALATYNVDRGGSVALYNDLGECYNSIIYPIKVTAEINQLVWHPKLNMLITTWTNSDLLVWNEDEFLKFSLVHSPHQKLINGSVFNKIGSRLVTFDQGGLIVGWFVNISGSLSIEFQKNFKDTLTQVCFYFISAEGQYENYTNNDVPSDDNQCFYVITKNGIIYYIDKDGNCSKILVIKCRHSIDFLIGNSDLTTLHIMRDGSIIETYKMEKSGKLSELSTIQFHSSKNPALLLNNHRFLLAGHDTLVILMDDLKIRVLYLNTKNTCLLPIDLNPKNNECVISLAFCGNKNILTAATRSGQILFWSRKNTTNWILKNTISINNDSNPVREISWNPYNEYGQNILAINCSTKFCLLKEQEINVRYFDTIWAIQIKQSIISIETESAEYELNTGVSIMKMDMNLDYLAITDCQEIVIFKIRLHFTKSSKLKIRELYRFSYKNDEIYLLNNILLIITRNEICIKNLAENMDRKIRLIEPICTKNLTSNFLTISFSNHLIQVYEFKFEFSNLQLITESLILNENNDFSEIFVAKYFNGLITFLANDSNGLFIQKLYIWNVETKRLNYFKLTIDNFIKQQKYYFNSDDNFYSNTDAVSIMDIFWDLNSNFNYLICCLKQNQEKKCLTFLIADDEIYPISTTQIPFEKIITYESPYLIVCESKNISKIKLKEFEEFSEPSFTYVYNICKGNLVTAFDTIQSFKSDRIWQDFAKNCVLYENFDFALQALSLKKDFFGIELLRLFANEKKVSTKAKYGILALYLGMTTTAEQLLIESNSLDLLVKFYCEMGNFETAIETCEKHDKLMLKNTYYQWGKHLESLSMYNEALENFKKAGTLKCFLSKMLIDQPSKFIEFVFQSEDKNLMKWLAKFYESRGDFNEALNLYSIIEDHNSRIRILCNMEDLDAVNEILNALGDNEQLLEAYYYCGQFYEKSNNFYDALKYFLKAKAYYSVKRICKDHKMISELLSVYDIIPNSKERLECAKIFELNQFFDEAISLYKQLGLNKKALNLALNNNKFEHVENLSKMLCEYSDLNAIEKYANHFMETGKFDKAAEYDKAIELCSAYNLTTIEDEIEKHLETVSDQKQRSNYLEKFAKLSKHHGNYNLASRRYIQSGNRYKAIKSLLKSGDCDQIIMFANISNQKDIYKLVANWFQKQPKLYANYAEIVCEFYKKAEAFDLLISFYVLLAQDEININHNYNNAFQLLKLAMKNLSNVVDNEEFVENAQKSISSRVKTISQFIQIQHLFNSNDFEKALWLSKDLIRNFNLVLDDKTIHIDDFLKVLKENYNFLKHDTEAVEFIQKWN